VNRSPRPPPALLDPAIADAVEHVIDSYDDSRLRELVDESDVEPLVIKFVSSRWAAEYATPQQLKISATPALTWGTATYVTPILYPLSSALYGRIGLVTDFEPGGWRIFDATRPVARRVYLRWVRAQANYDDLVMTVHSTFANHELRNKFRRDFAIDCVLFHPDQNAELHTHVDSDIWMAVTDWKDGSDDELESEFSARLAHARFTVLMDEDFDLVDAGDLPIRIAPRKIEPTTLGFGAPMCMGVSAARVDTQLSSVIAHQYRSASYLHVYVEP
jgi:hypothetical protein